MFFSYAKCLIIDTLAKTTQQMLNQIIVGIVLIVEVMIKARLDTSAKRYIHHHCLSKIRPGTMIEIFVIKAQASIMFTFVQ